MNPDLLKKKRKVVLGAFALALVFGLFFGFSGSVDAQGEKGPCQYIPGLSYTCYVDGAPQCTPNKAVCDAVTGVVNNGVTETLFKFAINTALGPVITTLTWFLFAFFGFLVKAGGLLMNMAIDMTVLKASNLFDLEGLRIAWQVIRDVLNIGFIFTIVYIGISTILRLGKNTQKLLKDVIIAALLVNFSFFFTGVLIDASNIFTFTAYNEIVELQAKVPEISFGGYEVASDFEGEIFSPEDLQEISATSGISGLFMRYTGIVTLFKTTLFDGGSALIVAVFGSIFLMILAFGFFFVAFLLFLRIAILMILIVTSPIGVIGSAFPGLGKFSGQWWSALWGQLIFAPLYMIMTLVVALIFTSKGFAELMQVTEGQTFAAAIIGGFSRGSIGIFVNYLLISVFLIGSVAIAKGFATQGGGVVADLAKKAGQAAGGAFGLTGRNTLGILGNKLAASSTLQKRAAKGRGVSRLALYGANYAKGASFDPRATGLGKDIAPILGAGKATGKGGIKKRVEDAAKRYDERAKYYGELSKEEISAHPEMMKLIRDQQRALFGLSEEEKKKEAKELGHEKEREKLERKLKYSRQSSYIESLGLPKLSDELVEAGKAIDGLTSQIERLKEELEEPGLTSEDTRRIRGELNERRIERVATRAKYLATGATKWSDIRRLLAFGGGKEAGIKKIKKRMSKSEKDKLWEAAEKAAKKSIEEEGSEPKTPVPDDPAPAEEESNQENN